MDQDIAAACVCHKVRSAARAVTRAYDDALRPVGLRATQFAVLVQIAADDTLSITAAADFLGMDRTTLTRNLRPLEQQGLIALGPEGWRRSRTLAITAKGRARLREATPLWRRAQDALKRKLGDTAWRDIRASLDRLIHAA